MSNSIKLNSRAIVIGFTSLAITAFAGQAMAQDYSVKITRTADVSVETEYALIKQQINKYCRKMERGKKAPISMKVAQQKNCQDMLITDFLKQTNDPTLLAYHNGTTSSPSATSKFVQNDKETKSN